MTAPLRPGQFFNPDYGLMARRAADAVLERLPLRFGTDGTFWAYGRGVWAPADGDVSKTIVKLLEDRYRPHHETAIRAVLRASVAELPATPAESKINVPNGMVHWDHPEGPEIIAHHELYLSTVQLPVRYVEGATCPEFDAFVEASVAPDDRQRLWEILGYMLLLGNPLQRMFLLTGNGGNGKGVFLHVLQELLGSHNVATVPLHEFIGDPYAPADLFGTLANICGDIDTTYIESTGKIKELSGEDRIRAQRKYGQPFRFRYDGKSVFSANGIPASADPSRGWTRRWEVIDFPNAPAKPDRGLKVRLAAPESLEGVMRKAVLALRDLMARGDFQHGAAAERAHDEFAEKSNKVLSWSRELMFPDESTAGWYPREELLKAFRRWDAFNNPAARPMGSHTFYERMRAITGVQEKKRRGVWGFAGHRFRAEIAYGEVIDGSPESDTETAPDEGGQIKGQGELPL